MRVERVRLIPLHRNQQPIFDSIAIDGQRATVVDAGRRFGKSYLATDLALEYAINRGKRVWWITPTNTVAKDHWEMVKDILSPKNKNPLWTAKNEVNRILAFNYSNPDGSQSKGMLRFRSGEKASNLRGGGLDLIIFDEAAYIDPLVWKSLKPALTDRKGQALFISTPNIIEPFNWFHTLYQKGFTGDNPRWKSWYFTSYDNPMIDPEEIDDSKNEMSEVEFNIEHLAKFESSEGKVFRNPERLATEMPSDPKVNGVYSMGIDIGRKTDATVITVMDLKTKKQVYIERFTKTGYSLQAERIKLAAIKWHPIELWIEENSAAVLIENLEKDGVKNIKPFYTSSTTKGPLIEALSIAIDKGTINLLSKDTYTGNIQLEELKAYEMHPNRKGDAWTYSAPRGKHDDCVMALALACQSILKEPAKVEVTVNVFYPNKTKSDKPKRRSYLDRYRKVRTTVIPLDF